MNDYSNTELKIVREFKNLIPPLSAEEYKQLEENLLSEGCRDPICVWDGVIIDGHNRYEICSNHKIPYKIQHINLRDANEAVAWICANQIGRRNITEATRKYLVGKRYEAEKRIGAHNIEGKNQHSADGEVRPTIWVEPPVKTNHSKTARRLGGEYQLSLATVEKYGAYTRAIDTLTEKDSELTPKILSGQTKISYENVIELAKLPAHELKNVSKQLSRNDRNFVGYAAMRRDLENRRRKPKEIIAEKPEFSVKDMPAFDPDAEISSLTLTIPSWISSMNRTGSAADPGLVSDKAKNKLTKMLGDLKKAADALLGIVKEQDSGKL